MSATFELQGHRGARGLRPENTLPSFEAAFDVGVTSIETDVHLTRDGVAVLIHDAVLSAPIYTGPAMGVPVSRLSLAELRGYRAAGNPDPQRFPQQDATVTPLAGLFGDGAGMDPYAVPTVADLFAFAAAYAGEPGAAAGKTDAQRARAGRVVFDLELKRVPFHPETIGDDFRGDQPGLLERRVVEAITEAGVRDRVRVRSFDHRSVRAIRALAPNLPTGLLMSETAVLSPGRLAREAGCDTYCPNYHFLDEAQVQSAHADGVRVLCWTANAEADWERLVAWGVDGITTDYPDRLVEWLGKRGILL